MLPYGPAASAEQMITACITACNRQAIKNFPNMNAPGR
jgi:hypothetical protein